MKILHGIVILFMVSLLFSYCLEAETYYATIDRNEDDGMEYNDTVWMVNGYLGNEPKNYMGRMHENYSDIGLRFHLDHQNQGYQFALAQLRLIPAASNVESNLRVMIRGVDLDSAPGFSQDNRPSQQDQLTSAMVLWESDGWHADEDYSYVQSVDISPIINEILARPGWGSGEEGKTVAVLIENMVSDESEVNYVAFEDFHGGNGPPATLELYESMIDTFIGGAVLSKPTSDSISISVAPRLNSDFYIEFGPSPGNYTKAIGETQTDLPVIDPVLGFDPGSARELNISGLTPGSQYYYRFRARENGDTGPYEEGPESSFITCRPPGEPFNFTVLTDSHIGVNQNAYDDRWELGFRTMADAKATNPDFFITTGDDALTQVIYINGQNSSSKSQYDADLRYSRVRQLYGHLANSAPIFMVLGNHEGEAGFDDPNLQTYSLQARSKYFFNPDETTYVYGGGPKQNYFAWEWGDALFVCLDIMSYTGPDDPRYIEPYGSGWHLGNDQMSWLASVLSTSQARWKFVFAHHILASWELDGYGRGGARYANEHEQAIIQQMMLDYGAQIFFYGHDHVFSDGTENGIHYTLCSDPTGKRPAPWATPGHPYYPYFVDAYPYGFLTHKGFLNVRVSSRSVWVDFVKSSLDDGENGKVFYSYHLADVTVMLIPPEDTTVHPGGSLSFDAEFTNHTDQMQVFDYWIIISLSWDGDIVYDVVENEQLNPNESRTVEYDISVPPGLLPGSYIITCEVGDYPDEIISRNTFSGEILP